MARAEPAGTLWTQLKGEGEYEKSFKSLPHSFLLISTYTPIHSSKEFGLSLGNRGDRERLLGDTACLCQFFRRNLLRSRLRVSSRPHVSNGILAPNSAGENIRDNRRQWSSKRQNLENNRMVQKRTTSRRKHESTNKAALAGILSRSEPLSPGTRQPALPVWQVQNNSRTMDSSRQYRMLVQNIIPF